MYNFFDTEGGREIEHIYQVVIYSIYLHNTIMKNNVHIHLKSHDMAKSYVIVPYGFLSSFMKKQIDNVNNYIAVLMLLCTYHGLKIRFVTT